jgi:tape measure domain-containing protein
MPTVANINVALRIDVQKWIDGLKSAEKSLRSSGRNLASLGQELSLAVSAPLALLGVSAIKSAGDLEKLTNAMATTMGSAEAAEEELAKLRKEALKPGLNLTQAVEGSLRLQAVGLSADQSRASLAAFGNALTLAGKSSTDLDGVTLALTQIISKGKVSAEEINQIAERVPQIRMAMKKAFGTADTEVLQKMGIGAEDFVKRVTAEIGKLPQATGGIANSIENAMQSVKLSMASVGLEISKAFDVPGKLEAFAAFISGLTEAFSGLDAGTKELVIGFGLFLIAAGPAAKVLGALKMGLAQAAAMSASFLTGLKGLSAGIVSTVGWFGKLNLAMKLSVIGATIAAVLLLVAAYKSLTGQMSTAEKIAKTKAEISQQVAHNTAQERTEAERLAGILKSETATREQKEAALRRLNALAPDIFQNLKLEKGGVEGVNAALAVYIKRIEARAKMAALGEKLNETEKKLWDTTHGLNEEVKPGLWETAGNFLLAAGTKASFFALQQHTAAENTVEATKALNEQKKVLAEQLAALEQETSAIAENTETTALNADAIARAKEQAKAWKSALEEITAEQEQQAATGEKSAAALGSVIEAQIKKLSKAGLGPASAQVGKLRGMLKGLRDDLLIADGKAPTLIDTLPTPEQIAPVKDGLLKIRDYAQASTLNVAELNRLAEKPWPLGEQLQDIAHKFNAFSEAAKQSLVSMAPMQETLRVIAENYGVVGQAMAAAGIAISETAAQGELSFAALGKAALAGAAEVVKGFMMQAVAALAADAFKKFGLFGFIGALAGGGAVIGLFSALMSKITAPKLAKGGLAFGETLATIGDNRGSSVDPEVVAPLSKLKQMGFGGGGRIEVTGTLRASGKDLLVVVEGAQRDAKRTRGY